MGPGKNTHGTLGPCKRGGRGWPTTTAQRSKCRTHQTVQNTGLPTNMVAEHVTTDEEDKLNNQLVQKTVEVPKEKTEIDETKAVLTAGEQFLVDSKERCSLTDREWETRQKIRQEEIAAVSNAP